jgi:hypothetical protein
VSAATTSYLDKSYEMMERRRQDLIALGWNDNLNRSELVQVKHRLKYQTFPMSVTLTALNKIPLLSSTTAMLLTPSSLISFMASRIVLEEVAETTASLRFIEGSESD